ncbi:c-type cytochrome domain-containing protein [Portibacter lacus]|uniref:Cytochrome c domain-containing protein n=1 Tax=Portibacter lacus TaxID=1099794 RepID=A0AA37SNJ2_9BACT|nr:c-type cytochrome domain-containing protein [Portibacter lacus]GLR15873.1 hypothetical protein GCM10007940_04880 [Portibacter lacus]
MIDFLGRTHLLLLHLPIGILLLGFTIEWARHFKWITISKSALSLAYFIGALSAIFACLSGYFLSEGYNYTDEETYNHFWAGIVTAVLATSIFMVNVWTQSPYQKWLALGLAISVAVTGHLGGSLTHGEGFLNPATMAEEKSSTPVFDVEDIPNAQVFDDIIFPVLDAKCISCHGPNKIKGKLRMDSPDFILAGGKSGDDLMGQNGAIQTRIDLPISNDKHMPPKNKTQLTEDENIIISWWLANGGSFDSKVNEINASPDFIMQIEKMIRTSSAQSHEANIAAFLPEEDPGPIDEEALIKIKASNIVALPAGEESNFVELNFVNVENLDAELFSQLDPILNHITRLQLSDQDVTDEHMKSISRMKNLVKLYLDNTKITDQGISLLKDIPYLNYLNVNGTQVSDAGISSLSSLPQLKKVYGFHTGITLDSLSSGIEIIKGNFVLEPLPSDTIRL